MKTLNQKLLFWTLFSAMSLTVPVLFFLIQAAAIVPLVAIVTNVVGMDFSIFMYLFALVHVLIYGAIFWALSYFIARSIFRISSPGGQRILLGTLLIFFALIAYKSPYGAGGHGNPASYTWSQTFFAWVRAAG